MIGDPLRLIPGRMPKAILEQAIRHHHPSKFYVLFSGGKDSSVLLDYMWRNFPLLVSGALHIRTGIGLESTTAFAVRFCADRNIPLEIAETPPGEYDAMVREHGFPGPGVHLMAYVLLKERALDKFIAAKKTHRMDHIAFVTGVRIAESKRRMGTTRDVVRDGATVWVSPLIDWTNSDMAAYRAEFNVQMSPASEKIHMSGECLCGAMADDPSEIVWIEAVYGDDPAVLRIRALERELESAGNPRCRWGVKVEQAPIAPVVDPRFMPLCFECESRS